MISAKVDFLQLLAVKATVGRLAVSEPSLPCQQSEYLLCWLQCVYCLTAAYVSLLPMNRNATVSCLCAMNNVKQNTLLGSVAAREQ